MRNDDGLLTWETLQVRVGSFKSVNDRRAVRHYSHLGTNSLLARGEICSHAAAAAAAVGQRETSGVLDRKWPTYP